MRALLLSFQFLTVIPLGERAAIPADELGRSLAFFPLVGGVLGGILVFLDGGFSLWMARPVVDFLLVLALVLLTGGLHLDGFADMVDGLAGGRSREETLAIMRESQIGSLAAAGLFFLLGLKYLFLLQIPEAEKPLVLIAVPLLSRWSMVLLSFCSRSAREEGLGHDFLQGKRIRVLFLATFLGIVGCALSLQGLGLGVMGILGGVTLLMVFYFQRRLGGITGDILGAVCEVNEVIGLFFLGVLLT